MAYTPKTKVETGGMPIRMTILIAMMAPAMPIFNSRIIRMMLGRSLSSGAAAAFEVVVVSRLKGAGVAAPGAGEGAGAAEASLPDCSHEGVSAMMISC